MNDSELAVVDQIKYLGVKMDEQLLFDKHGNYVGKKVWMKVSVLLRLRKSATTSFFGALGKNMLIILK